VAATGPECPIGMLPAGHRAVRFMRFSQ